MASKKKVKILTKVKAPKSKKITKSSQKKVVKKVEKKTSSSQKFYDQLKLSESYISLILGAVVVIGIFIISAVFINESKTRPNENPQILNSSITPEVTKTSEQTYIIQENETLWDVAVRYYGDGFRYVEIIEANNLENPDYVPPGTKIIVPNTE